MNKIIQVISFSLLVLSTSHLQAQESLRVIDQGTDGDIRYYEIICPEGTRNSVANHYVEGKVCTTPLGSREAVCRADWDVDTAAKEACK